MKRLLKKQWGPWCQYCAPKTCRATHRATGSFNIFACAEHKECILEYEKKQAEKDAHLTEADYQTWMRL